MKVMWLQLNRRVLICTESEQFSGSSFEASGFLTKVGWLLQSLVVRDSNQTGRIRSVKRSLLKGNFLRIPLNLAWVKNEKINGMKLE